MVHKERTCEKHTYHRFRSRINLVNSETSVLHLSYSLTIVFQSVVYAVIEDALALLTDERMDELAEIAVNQSELEASQNAIIPALKAEIHEVERSIANLLKLVERGSDSESLFNRLHELEVQKKNLEKRLTEELKDIVVLEKDHVVWWFHKFSKGDINDPDFRRQVIDMLVNSVTVWDEPDGWYKITTVYNLTSQNTKTFRCSDLGFSGSPNKSRRNEVAPAFVWSFFTNRAPPFSLAKKECLRPDQ